MNQGTELQCCNVGPLRECLDAPRVDWPADLIPQNPDIFHEVAIDPLPYKEFGHSSAKRHYLVCTRCAWVHSSDR
jgi:hypothetical protein